MNYISNDILKLRNLKYSDAEDLHIYRSDPQVCRFQEFSTRDLEHARTFCKEQSQLDFGTSGCWFQMGIALLSTDQLIGDCGVMFDAEDPRLTEIGYTLNPAFQGKGYATQAVKMLCDVMFSKYNVHRIYAVVDIRNHPSIGLLKRLSFRKEGHSTMSYWDKKENKWYDELHYALLNPSYTA